MDTVEQVYKKASTEDKATLEKLFGKQHFIPKRIKTFEEACALLKIKAASALPYKKAVTSDQKGLNAAAKLFIIARALNGKWKPDWTDSDQPKYYPFFEKTSKGLSYSHYADWYSYTTVGSRLCFETSDLAEYAGKQFIKIYEDF